MRRLDLKQAVLRKPLFGCCALFGRLGASRVVAGAVGSAEVLKRREINGDQTFDQEPGYAVT